PGGEVLAVLVGDLELLEPVDPAAAGDLGQGGGGRVVPDVVDEVQPVALAVLGGVGHAGGDGVGDAAHPDLLAAQVGRARDVPAPGAPEDAHRHLGAAGPHEAGDAHDLARPHGEGGVVDDPAPRLGRVVHGPSLDPEQLLADVRGPL